MSQTQTILGKSLLTEESNSKMPSTISVFSPGTNSPHILIRQLEYGDMIHMLLVANNRPSQLELFHTLLFNNYDTVLLVYY